MATTTRTGLVSIGEFSRMTHLTVKALRHYDAQGVLRPRRVDDATGYRSYHVSQVPLAQVVRRLRDLGMPLDEVRAVVGTSDVSERATRIAGHLDRMERQLDDVRASVASLRVLIGAAPAAGGPDGLGPGAMTGSSDAAVEFRVEPATWALAARARMPLGEAGGWTGSAYAAVDEAVRVASAVPSGPHGALFYPDVFERDRGDLVAFTPVAERPTPDGLARVSGAGVEVRPLRLPETEVAVMTHHGSCADIDWTYGALGQYVAERALGVDGPIREAFVVSALHTSDTAEHRTEVAWPVFRTRAG
jgi:DNA-binding transcriptional MerR regulator/effector-binding domain-containing protein